MASKKMLKAYSHVKKARHTYVCEKCYSMFFEKILMCRICKSMDVRHFASKAEAIRGVELLRLQQANQIAALKFQPRFTLNAAKGDAFPKIGTLVLDFSYTDKFKGGELVFEDVKGRGCPLTEMSAWKIKHFELQYGHKVEIIQR